jgi:hypothetical protein
VANQVTDAEITQIAQEYSIPPAILLGIVRSQGASPAFNIPSATLGAYSLSGSDVRNNPLLALTVAARTIAQSFSQTGSWEQALSTYLTGDPNAGSSPTSSVGGDIASILGQASVNASFGMSGYTPISISTFQTGANAFTQYQTGLVGQGGVVTHQSVGAWQQAATVAWSGGNKPGASANMEQVAEDILTAAKLPVTDANVAVITTMARGEGMNPSTNNWLATTTPEPGSGTFNSVGVQTFPSYAEGVDATARTLLNGNYKGMVSLMQKGADLKTIASNPEVQANLRTWQGGSSEDVHNLTHEANVPGKAPPKPKPEDAPPPDPSRVGEFASQLQGAQIDPRAFAQYFGPFAAQRRRLLGSKRTDVSDYATMQKSLAAQQVPVTNAGIIAHLRGEPHPTYPNVTVGAFHDTQDKALIHSMNHMQQYPADGEVAKLVGMDNRQLSEYYMQKAQRKAASSAGPGAQGAQTPDNVVPMPQQRGLAGGGGFTA